MLAPLRRPQLARLCAASAARSTRSIFSSFFGSPAAPALPHLNALPADAFADKQSQPRPFGFAVGADEQRRIEAFLDHYGDSAAILSILNTRMSEAYMEQRPFRETAQLMSDDVEHMAFTPYAAASPTRARQGLLDFLTRPYPTAIYSIGADHPLVGVPDVPTVDELHRGAEALFHWLTATFAAACQQVRDSAGQTPPTISFRAPKYADRIAPELAALLDAQIAHYALTGVVPVAEYRAPDASLHIARILPPRLVLNRWTREQGPAQDMMRLILPLTASLWRARSAARKRRQHGESTSGEPPSMAPLRVELFFQVAAEERMQWAGLEEGRLLTRREVSGLNIEHPSAHQLGLFCARTYSISVVADATLPLRFKLRNLNEAVWAV